MVTNAPFIQNLKQMAPRLTATTSSQRAFSPPQHPRFSAHRAALMQPRSQGLLSYRFPKRARRDPGTRWSSATLTIENISEGSSVVRQLVALSFVEFKVSHCAATDTTRDV